MAELNTLRTTNWPALILWALATAIGVFFAMLVFDSAFVDGEYIPMGNDSFYHARRMLDTAVGDRGFFQFDERIHMPEGNWVAWPWPYDYLMGKAAALAVWLSPTTDPLGFLSYVPVVWLGINAALFLAAARQAGLQTAFCAIAMLAFALSPFVQLMHMFGKVDHHFVEFTFVLLVAWLGMRWLHNTRDRAAAIGLGITLGLAPGFHIGMFILQIPVLVTLGLLWLRSDLPEQRDLVALAVALIGATLLILIPSATFRAGLFDFGVLSWFHLYVAVCSAIVFIFLAYREFAKKTLWLLIGVCIVLAAPLIGQVLHGAAFLSQNLTILDGVLEAMSPYKLLFHEFGVQRTVAHYSWLLILAPVVLLYYLWRSTQDRAPRKLFFAIMSVFGLAMLLTQFRFNYYGLFALIVGLPLAIQHLTERYQWNSGMVLVGLLAGVLVAYQPPLRQHLFAVYALGAAPLYERARPLFLELGERCEADPGLVLANANDGNYILFHTECSLISNNFRVNAADEKKINEIAAMMKLPPADLRKYQPSVKYLLLRTSDFTVVRDGQRRVDTSIPLARMLVSDSPPPEGYELLQSVTLERNGRSEVYAKAYAVR
ncbi:MAG: hypothetical protein AAF351_02205 [Pseudomonadota bacterium]